MSYVGEFRKGEINGEPFFIFTFLTQPNNPSSSSSSLSSETTTVSGGHNDLPQPLFICPTLRRRAEKLKRRENGYFSDDSDAPTFVPISISSCPTLRRRVEILKRREKGYFSDDRDAPTFVPISISPYFPAKDQQVQYLLDSDEYIDFGSDYDRDIDPGGDNCELPVVPLFWCNNYQESAKCEFMCGVCKSLHYETDYYICLTCEEKFHKDCVESPSQIKHPSYPFLSFQLSYLRKDCSDCICCKVPIDNIGYSCLTSKLNMHPVCALKPIPFVIDHPKRHPHPLTFFPKQAYLPCNVCGLIIESTPTYLCVPCVFVVHQDCVYFPNVIKISRHSQHRISFTSSLPSGKWSCGVCRKEVDNNYGAYSCSKCDGYFVHTRCALRRDLWDGKELEGVPEEPEIVVPPFQRIADGIIRHCSHGHFLKLENNRVDDEDKFCAACVLPIYEGNYYLCMARCDFILHEACANATRRKPHPLHAHLLTLKVVPNGYNFNDGYVSCNGCWRRSCGFVYESDQGGQDFRLDIRCALVSEPFEYQGHEHPLFLALTPQEQRAARCQICGDNSFGGLKLNCIECDYIICFRCATLPYKARYKHDKHLLTFRKEKEKSDESGWCESCEKKIVYSREGGFFSCDDYCGTTLHVDCLLGKDPYMRPGHTIMINGKEVHLVGNNTMSRPLCQNKYYGEHRCQYRVVCRKENKTFCCYYDAI